MKINKLCVICCFLMIIATSVYAGIVPEEWTSRPIEIRAVWMDKSGIPKTEQGIRKLIQSYAKSGINLVYPEVIFNGYSAYPSSYLTQKNMWNGLDVLGIIIDEAHKHGIEVHPCVWVFRVGNRNERGGILEKHPDWVALDKNGEALSENDGYWVCPSNPACRRILIGAIRELAVKYPVDGVHLDYIRFENQNPTPYCYNESCRRKFKEEHGIDPLDVQPFTEPVVTWHLWRENLVNTFVAQVREELLKVRPDIKLSVAVASDPDNARLDYLQDWRHWAVNEWVDFVAPMAYTGDYYNFLREVCKAKSTTGAWTLFAPGIGLHIQSEPKSMLDQVQVARTVPVSGISLFATSYLDEGRLKALAEGPFRKPAELPFRDPIKAAKLLALSAQNRLNNSDTIGTITEASLELSVAQNILDTFCMRMDNVGYLEPMRPPITIPETVQPLPSANIPTTNTLPVIDGKLDDLVWSNAAEVKIELTDQGKEAVQPAEVYLAYDSEKLYIAFRCIESKLDALQTKAVEKDGLAFQDDSVEIFLGAEGETTNYAHLVVNAIGTQYDEEDYDVSWNPEWQDAAGKESDAWTVEAAIPFASLGMQSPTAGTMLRGNFCRNRVLGRKEQENLCWSATYGMYNTPIRFGKLIFTGEGK